MRLHCLLAISCVSAISRSIPHELVQYGSPSLVDILVTPQCRLSSLVVRCILLVVTHAPTLHCLLAISCVSAISRSIPIELVQFSFPSLVDILVTPLSVHTIFPNLADRAMHPGYLVRSLLAASAIDLACCNVSPPHLSRGNPKDLLSCSVSFIPSSPWYLVELLVPDYACPRVWLIKFV